MRIEKDLKNPEISYSENNNNINNSINLSQLEIERLIKEDPINEKICNVLRFQYMNLLVVFNDTIQLPSFNPFIKKWRNNPFWFAVHNY